LLLALCFAAYANSLGGQFLFDDLSQVLANPTLRSLANLPAMLVQSVWQFLDESGQALGSYYRPLFNIVLILNYQLFGLAVPGWHLVSVLLHLVATFLVYKLGRQWGLGRDPAAAAALLFGLHPAHSESVAWVSGLTDPLAAVFLLPALILYERQRQRPAGRPAGGAALTLLALLSKETAIMLPAFLLVREWLDRPPGEPWTKTVRKNGLPLYLAAAAFYLAARYAVLGFLSQAEPRSAGVETAHVWLTLPAALVAYARILLVPYPLAVAYDWPGYVTSAADPQFWGLGAVVAGLLFGALRLARFSAPARHALLFLILFLLPVLNLKILNPYRSLVHDRYLYLPSVGFCVLLALGLQALGLRNRRLFWLGAGAVAALYFGLTVRQNRFWRDDVVMTEQALRVAPRNVFFLDYRGSHHFQQSRWAEAERYYRRALEFHPTYYESFGHLGEIYRTQQRYREAEQAYRQAIRLGTPLSFVYAHLGEIYALQDRLKEAEAALAKAVRMNPKDLDARYNLAWVYDRQGKTRLAETAYQQTLRQDPRLVEARMNLGVLLTRQGRYAEAIDQLQTALREAPRNAALWYELAAAQRRAGQCSEANQSLRRVLQLDPHHPRAQADLARCP
jgi:Flp pilus assembly protein TadD